MWERRFTGGWCLREGVWERRSRGGGGDTLACAGGCGRESLYGMLVLWFWGWFRYSGLVLRMVWIWGFGCRGVLAVG